MTGAKSALADELKFADIEGLGANTCAIFARAYAQEPKYWEDGYLTWAEGMMTGMNLLLDGMHERTRNFAGMSIDDQKAFLRNYCDTHPLKPYVAAVSELFVALPLNPVGGVR
jgi:hypothetical protein